MEKSERFKKGVEILRKMNPELPEVILNEIEETSPELAQFAIEFVFGDVVSQSKLDPKTTQLIIISTLLAMGTADAQLGSHFQSAVRMGCSKQDILEVLKLTAAFAGFPASMNGFNKFIKTFGAGSK